MQLILSQSDLEKMPPELRRDLMHYVSAAGAAAEGGEAETTALGRAQLTALLREASFHRDGKLLNALLKRLAYPAESEPPTRQRLAQALPAAAQAKLRQHLATVNRLTARVAKRRDARLWQHERKTDCFVVHPATRKALRDLLPSLARAGKSEEPLWEG